MMRLPETDNIHYQYAFKKGYRMALEGKTMQHMPSDIRRDMALREYFQEGWQQAVDEATELQQQQNQPDWKHRFIWLAIMIAGGLATAAHMIYQIEEEQALQQATQKAEPTAPIDPPAPQPNSNSAASEPTLTLLTEAQRKDLIANQQQPNRPPQQPLPLEPVQPSEIKVVESLFSRDIHQRSPVDPLSDSIPKYIRQVYFYTEIHHAKGQTLYHRWRTTTQILATIPFKVSSDRYRTWSSKRMASAWQGQWYVEVLDQQKHVIYRKGFNYGN